MDPELLEAVGTELYNLGYDAEIYNDSQLEVDGHCTEFAIAFACGKAGVPFDQAANLSFKGLALS